MRLRPEEDAFARSGEIEKNPVINENRYRNLLIFHKAIISAFFMIGQYFPLRVIRGKNKKRTKTNFFFCRSGRNTVNFCMLAGTVDDPTVSRYIQFW